MRDLGEWMHALVQRLHPICRSMTGDGVRRTLDIIGEHIPLVVREVPTGTPVLDWIVPREWNIRDAYIKDSSGRRVVDLAATPLHVVGYSAPVHVTLPLSELRSHLFTLPEQPELVPYRTGYHSDDWGFCLAESTLAALPDGDYEVCIDSTLADGFLTYAEHVVPGRTESEVIISCHTCHPASANETLAGIAVAVQLAQALARRNPTFTYRFVFAPATIGSITWLALNQDRVSLIKHGLVIACAGNSAPLRYKRSRRGDDLVDRAAACALRRHEHVLVDFTPYGYDERQFCSPGFNLAVGLLTRSPNEGYPEYHTSGDNPEIVTCDALTGTLTALLDIVEILEANQTYVNLKPYGEPQLGKRGLYSAFGSRLNDKERQMAILWLLNYSDGSHSLLDIAERSKMPFPTLTIAAQALVDAGLLVKSQIAS